MMTVIATSCAVLEFTVAEAKTEKPCVKIKNHANFGVLCNCSRPGKLPKRCWGCIWKGPTVTSLATSCGVCRGLGYASGSISWDCVTARACIGG